MKQLEKGKDATLMLVAPSYYLLMKKVGPELRETSPAKVFKDNLCQYLDPEFWPSISALYWMATFLDTTFKHLEFIPQNCADDTRLKRNLLQDLDKWPL